MLRKIIFLILIVALFMVVFGCDGGVDVEPAEPANMEPELAGDEPEVTHYERYLVKVEPNPEKGFYLPYYLSLPFLSVTEGEVKYLLVETANSPAVSDDFTVHEKFAHRNATVGWVAMAAGELNVPLLFPIIPRPPGNTMYHCLSHEALQVTTGQLARVDLQVIAMIADARERLEQMEIPTEEKVLFNGFSSSGNFATRFAMLHPEVVAGVVGGGNAAIPLPIEKWKEETLTYPVGIGDLEELIGKPFNPEEFSKVPMFVYMGGDDHYFQDDLAQYDGWNTRNQAAQIWRLFGYDVWRRWEQTQEIYQEHFPNVRFATYEGVEHTIPVHIARDALNFFRWVMDDCPPGGWEMTPSLPDGGCLLEPSTIPIGVPTKVRLIVHPDLVSSEGTVRFAVSAEEDTYFPQMIQGENLLDHIDVRRENEEGCFEVAFICLQKIGDMWEGEVILTLPKTTQQISVKATHESLADAFPSFTLE